MKNRVFILFLSLLSISLSAQETKSRKELKAEKKAKKHAEKEAFRKTQEELVTNRTFVLEADKVYLQSGKVFQINPSINFIYVKGEQAMVQLSSDSQLGLNGVGGITIKGGITKFTAKTENKKKPIHIVLNIEILNGFQKVDIWIYDNGNGEASYTDMYGNYFRFTGNIFSTDESKIYVGTTW